MRNIISKQTLLKNSIKNLSTPQKLLHLQDKSSSQNPLENPFNFLITPQERNHTKFNTSNLHFNRIENFSINFKFNSHPDVSSASNIVEGIFL